jgi:2-iminobutanoate/2-iminopropanoate deaminase
MRRHQYSAAVTRRAPAPIGVTRPLKKAGGGLANLVSMTAFINDPRNGDRFVELRKEMFPDGNYPSSALIAVTNFARLGTMLELQGIAVIGDRCSNTSSGSPR